MNHIRQVLGTFAVASTLLLPFVSNAQVWTYVGTEQCLDLCGVAQCSLCNPPFTPVCPSEQPDGTPCDQTVDDECWVYWGQYYLKDYLCL